MPVAALVVALHGHHDDPDRLAGRLTALASPSRIVFAPRSAISEAAGPVWFRSDSTGPVELDLISSLDRLDLLIDDLAANHGIDRDQVVLGGFSQGAAVALACALRSGGRTTPLAGVFSVSGWLPHAEGLAYDAPALAAGGTRMLVVHGADDDVVIVQQGRSAARYLERHGVSVRYVELSGGHHLGTEAVDQVARWIEG